MKKLGYLKNILFNSAILILTFIAVVLIVSSSLLLMHINISKVSFIVSGVITLAVYFLIYRFLRLKKSENTLAENVGGAILGICVFFISLFVCTQIYDLAHDSNWYHKAAIGCMANGWNPCYENITEFGSRSKIGIGNLPDCGIWVEHYCKASWIFGANVYSITGDIETAKSINILMVYVLFCCAYCILSKYLKSWQSIIIAGLLIFNPIILSQVFSLYIDNLLMTTLFVIVLLLADITYKKEFYDVKKINFLALFSAIVICINIKFTGLAYAGIFCFIFYLVWLGFSIKDKNFKKVFIWMTAFYLVTCIVAIILVGFSSYVKNFVEHGHPLYPLAGEGKVDIMTGNQPSSFDNMIGLKKLIYSVFSETDNIVGDGRSPKLKVPFRVSEYEKEICKKGADIRIAGFGPLFSGILCVCAPIILYGLFYLYKKNKEWFCIYLTLLCIIGGMLLLIQESWWARYSPYFYLVPLMAIMILFSIWNSQGKSELGITGLGISIVLSAIIFFNSTYFMDYPINCRKETITIKENLTKVSEISKSQRVNIKFFTYAYYGLEFNFRDYGINYKIVGRTTGELIPVYGKMAEMEVVYNEENLLNN